MWIARALTPQEKMIALRTFSYGLDPDRVRIHNRPYVPLQGKGVAMTPNGDLYFNAVDYKPNFGIRKADAAWLVHELTHAWQYQTGRSTRVRGLFEQIGRLRGHDPYPYGKIDPRRPFATYKNEQQAAMVEDWFCLRHGMPQRFGSGSLEDYETAIPFVPKTVAGQRLARA